MASLRYKCESVNVRFHLGWKADATKTSANYVLFNIVLFVNVQYVTIIDVYYR